MKLSGTRSWYTYAELFELADKFQRENQYPRPDVLDPIIDEIVKGKFAEFMVDSLQYRVNPEKPNPDLYLDKRISIWTKQALLDGLCPMDGSDLPCALHNIPKMRIDGRGGLEPDR